MYVQDTGHVTRQTLAHATKAMQVRIVSIQCALSFWRTIPLFAATMALALAPISATAQLAFSIRSAKLHYALAFQEICLLCVHRTDFAMHQILASAKRILLAHRVPSHFVSVQTLQTH
mmetsp:Transcript_6831/g.25517  ORF Transcript_6831/g.25517 Transcript_6831/m.25517 type:complete len:118 (-) Transcript_6831:5724-6077(-)